MFEPLEDQPEHQVVDFLTTADEVAEFVASHLSRVAEEFKPWACGHVKAGREGAKYLLSGVVAFKETKSYSDTYNEVRRESFLILGHAALGPLPAARSIASVRRELLKMLGVAVPPNAIEEGECGFRVRLADGDVEVGTMSGQGRSVAQVTSRIKMKGWRRL